MRSRFDDGTDDIKNLQSTGGESLAATEVNILGNHLAELWHLVSSDRFRHGHDSSSRSEGRRGGETKKGKKEGGRIDFILDNAGALLSFPFILSSVFFLPFLGSFSLSAHSISNSPIRRLTTRSTRMAENTGFELYCDCVYADWLMQSGLASTIHFHGKRFAWCVPAFLSSSPFLNLIDRSLSFSSLLSHRCAD